MHFWQIKKLRVKLAGEELTQRQEFIYYLGGAILVAALYEIVANGPATEQKPVDVLDAVMYFGFKIGGVIWCYRQNGGTSGRNFLAHMVPLAFVMFMRLVSAVIPLFVTLGVYHWIQTGELGRPGSETTALVFMMNCLYGAMWWRTGVHMKWVADHAKQ
ncbi:MAG: hypothetical protein CL799_12385 [Chromatiales bacterium]|jgi:hypothetical protein|nr:hypothetical protein [Chromatiales bacterium]MDP6151425.1 hypothetical protein [Gammaproteobacteria bacterium]MDP7270305.1 hypothetical protein [Gammaproteobacteria bacterium]HJP05257.1 hypothetical protein [Gammaproteobacteria bacterium]